MIQLNERNNVAHMYPKVVESLKERIEYYNATHVEQLSPPVDPKSNPENLKLYESLILSCLDRLTFSKYVFCCTISRYNLAMHV